MIWPLVSGAQGCAVHTCVLLVCALVIDTKQYDFFKSWTNSSFQLSAIHYVVARCYDSYADFWFGSCMTFERFGTIYSLSYPAIEFNGLHWIQWGMSVATTFAKIGNVLGRQYNYDRELCGVWKRVATMSVQLCINQQTSVSGTPVHFQNFYSCQKRNFSLQLKFYIGIHNNLCDMYLHSQPTTFKTTMARQKKRIGVRAYCFLLLKQLHPQNLISQYHPNYSNNEWLDDLVAVWHASITFISFLVPIIPGKWCDVCC